VGGALYMSDGLLTIYGGTVSGNTSDGDGGGLYISNGTVEVREGTVFHNNEAAGHAGAIWLRDCTMTIEGSDFAGNKVGAGMKGPNIAKKGTVSFTPINITGLLDGEPTPVP
jgi:hypothetical protein